MIAGTIESTKIEKKLTTINDITFDKNICEKLLNFKLKSWIVYLF